MEDNQEEEVKICCVCNEEYTSNEFRDCCSVGCARDKYR